MNNIHQAGQRIIMSIIALVLVTITILYINPPIVSATTSHDILNQAYTAYRNKFWIDAVIYFSIYLDRRPSDLDIPGREVNIRKALSYSKDQLNDSFWRVRALEKTVADLKGIVEACRYNLPQCPSQGGVRQMGTNQATPTPGPQLLPLCLPRPNEIALYEAPNYDGNSSNRCATLAVGSYPDVRGIGLRNDTISSVLIGSNVRAELCLHGSLTGECITFSSSDPDLRDNMLTEFPGYSLDNQTASVRVVQR